MTIAIILIIVTAIFVFSIYRESKRERYEAYIHKRWRLIERIVEREGKVVIVLSNQLYFDGTWYQSVEMKQNEVKVRLYAPHAYKRTDPKRFLDDESED